MSSELSEYKPVMEEKLTWYPACPVDEFPENGGLNFMIRGQQVAVFNFTRRKTWYATQNLCPHKQQMILSRGMIGSENDEPKVACPFHKKTYSLETGKNLNGDECSINTYPVKVENEMVFVGL